MLKNISLGATALLAPVLFAACGGADQTASTGAPAVSPTKAVQTASAATSTAASTTGAPSGKALHAPDFTLQSLDGKPIRLAELLPQKKAVLINFWQIH